MGGVWSSAGVRVVNALANLVTLPIAVRYLGPERYGVWITVTTTVTWIRILDLGVADSLINEIAKCFSLQDDNGAERWSTNGVLLTSFLALLGIVGVGVCRQFFPLTNFFNVKGFGLEKEVSETVAAGILVVLVGIPANHFTKRVGGYQQVQLANASVALATVLSVVGLLLGVHLHMAMPPLLLWSVGMTTWVPLLGLAWVITVNKPWLKPKFRSIHLKSMATLLSSGSSFLLINIAGILAFGSDNIVISHYLSPALVTPYAVTWRVAGYAGILQNLLFPSLWPAYTEAYAKGELGWLKKAVWGSLGVSLSLSVTVFFVLVFFGRGIIAAWAGEAAVPSEALIVAVSGWNIVAGLLAAQSNFLGAIGKNRQQGWLSIVAAIANIILSVVLVRHIGVIGVILGTILTYGTILVIPQTKMVISVFRKQMPVQ